MYRSLERYQKNPSQRRLEALRKKLDDVFPYDDLTESDIENFEEDPIKWISEQFEDELSDILYSKLQPFVISNLSNYNIEDRIQLLLDNYWAPINEQQKDEINDLMDKVEAKMENWDEELLQSTPYDWESGQCPNCGNSKACSCRERDILKAIEPLREILDNLPIRSIYQQN